MIDVHVLTHEGTRADWLEECLESLRYEACKVHIVDNRGFTVGPGRAKGYAMGSNPYVSFVDSDDYVLPGALEACLEEMESGEPCVATMELVLRRDGQFHRELNPNHHLFVARRELVLPYLEKLAKIPWVGDRLIVGALKPKQLNFSGYVWRQHESNAHNRSDLEPYEAMQIWTGST